MAVARTCAVLLRLVSLSWSNVRGKLGEHIVQRRQRSGTGTICTCGDFWKFYRSRVRFAAQQGELRIIGFREEMYSRNVIFLAGKNENIAVVIFLGQPERIASTREAVVHRWSRRHFAGCFGWKMFRFTSSRTHIGHITDTSLNTRWGVEDSCFFGDHNRYSYRSRRITIIFGQRSGSCYYFYTVSTEKSSFVYCRLMVVVYAYFTFMTVGAYVSLWTWARTLHNRQQQSLRRSHVFAWPW